MRKSGNRQRNGRNVWYSIYRVDRVDDEMVVLQLFYAFKKVMFNEIKDWVYFLFAGERKGLIPKKKEISQMVPSELNLSYQVNYRRSAHK